MPLLLRRLAGRMPALSARISGAVDVQHGTASYTQQWQCFLTSQPQKIGLNLLAPHQLAGQRVRTLSTTAHRPKGDSSSVDTNVNQGVVAVVKDEPENDKEDRKSTFWPKWMLKDHITAPEGFNRWLVPPASMGIHLCIGSVYAWSMFNEPLQRELGVVAAASADWGLGEVVPVFSAAIACLGLSAAVAGRWLEEVGPRLVGTVSALCWGGGFLIGGAGVITHSLPLLYLGYGVLGGCGLGLGYVSPVSTLLRWFPDRRGMATGLAVAGFGGGAIIAAPVKQRLMERFFEAPDFLGSVDTVQLVTQGGKRLANVAGELKEVVVASAAELSTLPGALEEGVYVVGTGCTGAGPTFLTLGAVYSAVMLLSAFAYRVPREGWVPEGYTPPPPEPTVSDKTKGAVRSMITSRNVHLNESWKTPQFYLLWTNLFANVTAGIGVIGVAKTMVGDIFGAALPLVVTGAFTAKYVTSISVFNSLGRFSWATLSDKIGRKATFATFFGAGIPLYLSVPYAAEWVSTSPGMAPLALFCGSTMVIFSMYGGGFATIPAYLADIFGTKYVGAIHGRLLTAWSSAGIMGPMALAALREKSRHTAIEDLVATVDPDKFKDAFGAPVDSLQDLIAANAVNIPRLMEIAPANTVDPTPFLYDSTMYATAGLLSVALVSNALIKPVDPKHWMEEDEHKASTTEHTKT